MPDSRYRGRFAPSPTGPLHFGSLVAAVGSFLDARARGGEWLVRMEDLDPPREVPGAGDAILRTLEYFGMDWDGEVLYQSARHDAYRDVLERLAADGHVYPCACSRRDIRKLTAGGDVYPGTCRQGLPTGKSPRSTRLRVAELEVAFEDRLHGPVAQRLAEAVGDFVLRRADGLFAYQLAVVIDDAEQGITDIVRGADLLDSTCRQIYLQRTLGYPTPRYLHLPVVAHQSGEKLSKQTGAAPVDTDDIGPPLVAALRFLGQPVPEGLERAAAKDIWSWAIEAWHSGRIPRRHAIRQR
jgi:glutamyl-Q tRNA(Asp) synthetase